MSTTPSDPVPDVLPAGMARYRVRHAPPEIVAVQFTGDPAQAVALQAWIKGGPYVPVPDRGDDIDDVTSIEFRDGLGRRRLVRPLDYFVLHPALRWPLMSPRAVFEDEYVRSEP